MQRVGLALSGGGFRATLYHLGMIRFLRDAEILPKITHITSVSGGSILGAHLALNWDKYCGSDSEFEQAADEVIRFVQLDVRNRIVRRFPFASTLNTLRRCLRLGSKRQLTRPGLLEKHYEKFLYGDVGLSQLPEHPQLHILSTNLSEGCLCSFNSDGLILQRRLQGRRDRFDRVNLGLATVPMAVAASSAFPGFFPPLQLDGWDVGAEAGDFDRQAFTDGGVYDNLGLRMFRCIQQSWVRSAVPLRADDFLEIEDTVEAVMSADNLPENSPMRRLRELLDSYDRQPQEVRQTRSAEQWTTTIVDGMWEVIRSERLYHDPCFMGVVLPDCNAESLLHYIRTFDHEPEVSDRLWLNRQIVEAVLSQGVGKPCLRAGRDGFDAILVSDAGGKFKVARDGRAGGLIKTALRSTDILMDRVWQLELEAFANTPGVLFAPITEIVESSQDRWAPHPEIQRQAARMRTDLDRFSNLEISALVQHGYCVARSVCKEAGTFGNDLPANAPWDPCLPRTGDEEENTTPVGCFHRESQALPIARQLRNSTRRRTWSTLLSWRDWPTYVWVPLLLTILFSLPYTFLKLHAKSQRQQMVLSAVAETSPIYRKVLTLLEEGPVNTFVPAEYVEVDTLEELDYTGYKIISDSRIIDLRRWSGKKSAPFVHDRIRIRRTAEGINNTKLRFQLRSKDDKPFITCRNESLSPVISRMKEPDGTFLWELLLDFSHVPLDSVVDIVLDGTVASEQAEELADGGRFAFAVPVETGMIQIWMLMPQDRTYDRLALSSYPTGQPHLAHAVVPDTTVELPLGSIATFRFISPEADRRYECRWRWSRNEDED